MESFNTPILFIIFNRLETAQLVFNEIKKIKPKFLYITADGPREEKIGEKEKCESVRAIFQEIDWDCEIKTLFHVKNLGCDENIITALNWFFENVEAGIILEDDCLPSQSFFFFCQTLLEYYKNNPRIMHISGDNFKFGKKIGEGDYYFSRYTHSWGWATWRRSWQYFDKEMNFFPEFKKENKIKNILNYQPAQKYWLGFFKKLHYGKFSFWDAKWLFTVWTHDGISILPNQNLVSNIGFGKEATHTKKLNSLANISNNELTNQIIVHPSNLDCNQEADKETFRLNFSQKFLAKIWNSFNFL